MRALASIPPTGHHRRPVIARTLAVALLGTACGSVNSTPMDDAGGGTARTYKGSVTETSPVTFGGPPPDCVYTMRLRQLEIEIAIDAGQITSGTVQTLNVEGLVMPCMYRAADPTITHFTYATTTPGPGGQGVTLTFKQRAGDKPGTDLSIDLNTARTAFQAQMTFRRNDLPPPLEWTIVTTASLLP